MLAVFAHPDDETVACGGTLHRLARCGADATLLILTAGERGNPSGVSDARLKTVRHAEADAAARCLRLRRVVHADCGDGVLHERAGEAETLVSAWIEHVRPDLIITHDLAGIDGHTDHIACADAVTRAWRGSGSRASLWYATIPRPLRIALRAIGQLRTGVSVEQRRTPPVHSVFVARDVPAKIAAWRAHRSQRSAVAKGLGRLVPTSVALGLLPFEWFAEADQPVD